MFLWYHFLRNLFLAYFRLFYDLRYTGMEHLPAKGGYLIASNHVSFYDPPVVGCGIQRETYYLARKTLFVPPIMDKLLPTIKAVPVDQDKPDMAGLKKMIEVLKSGDPEVLFPEGSRSYDGKLQEAKPGIGLLVAKAGVTVIPARIFGAMEAWPRDGKIRLWQPIEVVFGPALDFKGSKEVQNKDYQAISNKIMAAIELLQPETL